jgi:cell division protein FtsB
MLAGQCERQSAELTEASEHHAILAGAVAKACDLLQKHESAVIPAGDAANIALLEGIRVDGIAKVCRAPGLGIGERLERVVQLVNDAFREQRDSDARLSMLEGAISGVFRFLDALSSRPSVATLLGSTSLEECKSFLVSQVSDLRSFMDQHAVGYVHDSCLFEEMLKPHKPEEIVDALQRWLPDGSNDSELFIVLMQVIAANDVLRKFSADSAANIARQAREIKALKRAASQARKQAEQAREMDEVKDEALVDAIDAIRSLLRSALLKGQTVEPVLEALESIDTVVRIDDPTYVHGLEQQLVELRESVAKMTQQVKALQSEKEHVIDKARSDIEHLSSEIGSISSRMAVEVEREKTKNSELLGQLASQLQEIDALKTANKLLMQGNDKTTERFSELEDAAKASLLDLEKAFEETQADCLRLLEMKEARNRELDSVISRLKVKSREDKRRLRSSLVVERNERNALQLELQESHSLIEQTKDDPKAPDELERLKRENRHLKGKIKSREHHFQRERDVLEQQAKLQLLNAQNGVQAKVDEVTKASALQNQQFLASVCKTFNSFVDVKVPISFEAVDAMLRRVKDELEGLKSFRKARMIVDEMKSLLNADQDKDVLRAVADLVKATDRNGEVGLLRQSQRDLTKWVEKIFGLCGGKFVGTADLDGMKVAIERALQGRGRGQRLSRGHPDDSPSRGTVELSPGSYIFDQ